MSGGEIQPDSAAERSRRLRMVGALGLAGDVVVSIVLILLKDSLDIGNLVYLLAGVLLVAGVSVFVFLPMIPGIEQRRSEQEKL